MKILSKIYKIISIGAVIGIFACARIKNSYMYKNQSFDKTDFRLIINNYNKKIPIIIKSEESIKNLKLKIWDKLGIAIESQILRIGNRNLSNYNKLIKEYDINNLDEINLNLRINGGMHAIAKSGLGFGAYIFPNFNKNIIKYGDVSSKGPEYRTVTSGANIAAYCKNKKCPSNKAKDYVWIFKNLGIGYFNVAEATDYVSCSACGNKISQKDLLGVGFFDCNYKVKGKRVKNPEKFPKDVNYDQFCFDRKTQKDKIEKYFSKISGFWVYLIITTSKIK